MDDPYKDCLNTRDAAHFLGVKYKTLLDWRLDWDWKEKGPGHIKFNDGSVLYRISVLEAWKFRKEQENKERELRKVKKELRKRRVVWERNSVLQDAGSALVDEGSALQDAGSVAGPSAPTEKVYPRLPKDREWTPEEKVAYWEGKAEDHKGKLFGTWEARRYDKPATKKAAAYDITRDLSESTPQEIADWQEGRATYFGTWFKKEEVWDPSKIEVVTDRGFGKSKSAKKPKPRGDDRKYRY